MKKIISSLCIYSLLHLSIYFSASFLSQAYAMSALEKKSNFMKTIHQLPRMAADNLISPESLDDIIARGKEVVNDKSTSLDEKARITNTIIVPLEQVRDGSNKLDDCISKRDPSVVNGVRQGFLVGTFSKMKVDESCLECTGQNPQWDSLSKWTDDILTINSQIKEPNIAFDPQTEELKNKLYHSERERILIPYLAMKASIEKEPLAETPKELLEKMGLATTVGDLVPRLGYYTTTGIMGMSEDPAKNDSIIEDNLRRSIQNMIDHSRNRTGQERREERESFFTTTNQQIEEYNRYYRELNGSRGDQLREQIVSREREDAKIAEEMIQIEERMLREQDQEKRQQLGQEHRRLQARINDRWQIDNAKRQLQQLEYNLSSYEQKMAINPIINGAALDRNGRGKDAPTIRDELFHKVENITREKLSPAEMDRFLVAYYEASEKLLKYLDNWKRALDPAVLIENTLYSNPAVAAEVLKDNPEMAGKICHHIERAVRTKDRWKKWDEISDWVKIVALLALILATGGAFAAGGAALAASIGISGLKILAVGGAGSAVYNTARGVELRSDYHKAKEHMIALGYGDENEVTEMLTLSKKRFVTAVMDGAVAATSGPAFMNGVSTVRGGLVAVSKATAGVEGIKSLVRVGSAVTGGLTASHLFTGCSPIMIDIDELEDERDQALDDENAEFDPTTGEEIVKYPKDKDCYDIATENDKTLEWDMTGDASLVNLFRVYWGRDGSDFPDSEVTIDNQTRHPFNLGHMAGTGLFYVTVAAVFMDMTESSKATPIKIKICQ